VARKSKGENIEALPKIERYVPRLLAPVAAAIVHEQDDTACRAQVVVFGLDQPTWPLFNGM
jgi:hypothetical protein